jgi:hypothetical protein
LASSLFLLEREILNKIKQYIKLDNYSVNIDSVKSKLGPNDIAVEFINYPMLDTDKNPMVYDALIIKKDWPNAILISIKSEEIIKKQYYTPIAKIP